MYESGDQFLKKLPLSEAGCILLDLQMVGMNGFELQERLTKAGNILPIIFLTAHGDIGAGVHAIKAGARTSCLNLCPGKHCCNASRTPLPATSNSVNGRHVSTSCASW